MGPKNLILLHPTSAYFYCMDIQENFRK